MSVSYRLFEFDVYDDIIEDKDPMWDNKEFQVQMFGINETGETACILVTGFKPFFYVQIEDNWTRFEHLIDKAKLTPFFLSFN